MSDIEIQSAEQLPAPAHTGIERGSAKKASREPRDQSNGLDAEINRSRAARPAARNDYPNVKNEMEEMQRKETGSKVSVETVGRKFAEENGMGDLDAEGELETMKASYHSQEDIPGKTKANERPSEKTQSKSNRLRTEGEHGLEGKTTGKLNPPAITSETGRLSQAEIDRTVQDAEKFRADDESNRLKTEARNGLESYCFTMRTTLNEER